MLHLSIVPGAGDAFVGSFAHFLSSLPSGELENHDSIRRAILKACAVATFSVQRPGTQSSFPLPTEIKEYL
jgi:ribokinase